LREPGRGSKATPLLYSVPMSHDRIVLLSYDDVTPYNVMSFRRAAAERNIRLREWIPHRISIWCGDGRAEPLYDNAVQDPGVIIHRTVSRLRGIVAPALRLWESSGSLILNDLSASALARDKLATALRLTSAGLPVVPSLAFFPWEETSFSRLPPGGTVIKPAHGRQGQDVSFFATRDEAEASARAIQWGNAREILSEHSLAQPVTGPVGQDIRAYVVNGSCVAVARRTASDPHERRANLTLGAVATPLPLGHPAAALAVVAIEATGLDYAGVDMVESSDRGLQILEVDAWAGFAGLEQATGADISGRILDLAIERLG
jgi:ribosomal protein S6--L-glutamate ligase